MSVLSCTYILYLIQKKFKFVVDPHSPFPSAPPPPLPWHHIV